MASQALVISFRIQTREEAINNGLGLIFRKMAASHQTSAEAVFFRCLKTDKALFGQMRHKNHYLLL